MTFNKGDKVQFRGDERAHIVTKIDGDKIHVRVARAARFDRHRFHTTTADKLQPYSGAAKAEREAAKAQKAKTCQICGRQIHAAKGLIAHHGYQRPQHGWQTASCYGARYRPFEVSSARLQEYLASIVPNWIRHAEADVARLQVAGVEVPGPAVRRRDERGMRAFDSLTGKPLYDYPLIGAGHAEYSRHLLIAQTLAARELAGYLQHQKDQQARLDAWKPAEGQ